MADQKDEDPPLAPDIDQTIVDLDPRDETSDRLRRRLLLRRFWQSATGFWGSNGEHVAWVLSAAILLTILLNLAAAYGMNVWNRAIFDALERRDGSAVLFLSLVYFPLLAASVFLTVMQVYAKMTTQRRWRGWLTHHLLDRWLKNGRYYQLNLVTGDHKNPEYRIADDVRLATESPVDFVAGVTTAVLSAGTFIVVLWTIGGSLSFRLAGVDVTIPGFLVVAAVLYAVLASGSMVFIGRRFVTVSENKNQAEAEYRYVLTRLNENGESIAVLGGEVEERSAVDISLRTVLHRWREICLQTMRTTIVSQTSGYIAPVLPIMLCAPKFLDGSMTLGQVMQAASAFTIVQAAFNWLVDNYPRLADWTASARRVSSLMVSLDALERAESGEAVGRIERGETAKGGDAPGRAFGHARRRYRGGQGRRGGDRAGRTGAGRRRIRHRQEHAGARHLRLVALGARHGRGSQRRENDADAATRLRSGRHAAAGGHLSRAPESKNDAEIAKS